MGPELPVSVIRDLHFRWAESALFPMISIYIVWILELATALPTNPTLTFTHPAGPPAGAAMPYALHGGQAQTTMPTSSKLPISLAEYVGTTQNTKPIYSTGGRRMDSYLEVQNANAEAIAIQKHAKLPDHTRDLPDYMRDLPWVRDGAGALSTHGTPHAAAIDADLVARLNALREPDTPVNVVQPVHPIPPVAEPLAIDAPKSVKQLLLESNLDSNLEGVTSGLGVHVIQDAPKGAQWAGLEKPRWREKEMFVEMGADQRQLILKDYSVPDHIINAARQHERDGLRIKAVQVLESPAIISRPAVGEGASALIDRAQPRAVHPIVPKAPTSGAREAKLASVNQPKWQEEHMFIEMSADERKAILKDYSVPDHIIQAARKHELGLHTRTEQAFDQPAIISRPAVQAIQAAAPIARVQPDAANTIALQVSGARVQKKELIDEELLPIFRELPIEEQRQWLQNVKVPANEALKARGGLNYIPKHVTQLDAAPRRQAVSQQPAAAATRTTRQAASQQQTVPGVARAPPNRVPDTRRQPRKNSVAKQTASKIWAKLRSVFP